MRSNIKLQKLALVGKASLPWRDVQHLTQHADEHMLRAGWTCKAGRRCRHGDTCKSCTESACSAEKRVLLPTEASISHTTDCSHHHKLLVCLHDCKKFWQVCCAGEVRKVNVCFTFWAHKRMRSRFACQRLCCHKIAHTQLFQSLGVPPLIGTRV